MMTMRLAALACLLMTLVLRNALADATAVHPEGRLLLREAVRLALRNNIGIELARTEPALAAEDVAAARGAYDPIAHADFSFDRMERPTANTLQASGGGVGLNLNSSDVWTMVWGSERTRIQKEVGVVAGVAITQAEAGVAEREVLLIQAESRSASAKDALFEALQAPSPEVFEDRDLMPEAPRLETYDVRMDEAIRKALRNRPELTRGRQAIDMAELEADFARNQSRPRFDLIAAYGRSGFPGPSKGDSIQVRDPSDPGSTLTAVFPSQGGSADAFDQFFRADGAKSYSFGARLEVPLGNHTAEARWVQRRIDARRAQLRLKQQEQSVIREVRDAVRGVRAATRAVGSALRRRRAAEESLRAEQERLRFGDSTPFQVLQFDEDLAEAEQQVIGALQAQSNAITALERVQGTLLDARGVRIEEELAR